MEKEDDESWSTSSDVCRREDERRELAELSIACTRCGQQDVCAFDALKRVIYTDCTTFPEWRET